MKHPITTSLMLPYEIEIHYKRPLFESMTPIKSAEDANHVLRSCINTDKIDLKECFWVLLLTNANRLLGISEVAVGTSTGVLINTKEILQLVLLTHANAIIVAHNHPSGKLLFSESDKKQTKRLQELAKIMEVNLLDHIIITSESFLSFANEGEL
ncbi:RadC-like JAB domain-containing protein [Lutibacter oricola]|uniref:RadC-like JAB domain-containing protein n=1 Tax=Lutibacter oricola TaxID=762486 RepID=A0A1H2WR80_9FLAO|nr:JAB domain-containing protein [Lutibacter oricola]SDW82489.1 RadC-like JAB domain-containing protein [Lutibacter oricola]